MGLATGGRKCLRWLLTAINNEALLKSQVSFSFPRIRPANDVDLSLPQYRNIVNDTEMVQMMLALRFVLLMPVLPFLLVRTQSSGKMCLDCVSRR